jgi:DNA glycosylase AlkZ-like
MAIDLREVARLRLRNQRIVGEKLSTPAEAVAWLGAVQAQEYSLAKWSLGTRVNGAATTIHDEDIDAALGRAEILRTHILRPTWHFVAPADIRQVQRLTAPRILSGSAHRLRFLELDDDQVARANDVMVRALEGGRQLTRPELQQELAAAGLHPDGQRIAYMVMAAEMACLIASGAPRAGRTSRPTDTHTYALLDEVAPPTAADNQPFDRDRALADLTLRYFTSHGPATIADFTWWCALNQADTKRGLQINGHALEELEVDGQRHWWGGGESADPEPPSAVHLLQAYDEYVVGYRSPRTPINVAGLALPPVLRPPPFFNTVTVDGQVVGYWRRLNDGDGYRIETSLLRPLTRAEQRALSVEVARYSDFAQRPVELASRRE